MKNNKRIFTFYYMTVLVIGLVLIALAFMGKLDEFWNGMGFGLAIVGALRLLREYRLQKNEAYREKTEVAVNDERNRFIRGKAWSWAGYLFIIITALAVIGFRLAGHDLLSQAASGAVCLMLVLYWGAYHVLKRKY